MLDLKLLLANIQSKENEMRKTGWGVFFYIFPILGKHAKTYIQFLGIVKFLQIPNTRKWKVMDPD